MKDMNIEKGHSWKHMYEMKVILCSEQRLLLVICVLRDTIKP